MHVLISEATGHSAVAGANSRLRSPWPHQLSYISPRERAPELGGGRGSLRVPGPVRECAGEEWREASEAVPRTRDGKRATQSNAYGFAFVSTGIKYKNKLVQMRSILVLMCKQPIRLYDVVLLSNMCLNNAVGNPTENSNYLRTFL